MSSKLDRLTELTQLRQNSRWEGYKCIGDYHKGVYECDYVSPYTRGACNVNAKVMVLLQDWASDDVLSGPVLTDRCTIGHDPKRQTNIQLKRLLQQFFKLELKDIYATNVFPFVKKGAMRSSVRFKDLVRAADEFAVKQIQIVAPRLAVCLGKAAFNALAVATRHPRAKTLADAIESPFTIGRTKVWCQAHTGRQGTNFRNRNGNSTVLKDWKRMSQAYQKSER